MKSPVFLETLQAISKILYSVSQNLTILYQKDQVARTQVSHSLNTDP